MDWPFSHICRWDKVLMLWFYNSWRVSVLPTTIWPETKTPICVCAHERHYQTVNLWAVPQALLHAANHDLKRRSAHVSWDVSTNTGRLKLLERREAPALPGQQPHDPSTWPPWSSDGPVSTALELALLPLGPAEHDRPKSRPENESHFNPKHLCLSQRRIDRNQNSEKARSNINLRDSNHRPALSNNSFDQRRLAQQGQCAASTSVTQSGSQPCQLHAQLLGIK